MWWFGEPARLGRTAYAALCEEANAVFVSAASVWEMATKHRLGRLPEADKLLTDLPRYLAEEGFAGLPVTLDHALRAGRLPGPHRDPFDRMLIAQAQAEGLWVATSDPAFEGYGVSVVW